MFSWSGRNQSATPAVNSALISVTDDGNDSDVSLLIANDGNENVESDVPTSPQNDGISHLNQQNPIVAHTALVMPSNDVRTPNQSEVVHERDDRSRRRRRHHRHRSSSSRRRDRLHHFKNNDSNFFSAILDLIVVVLACVAMFEPRWLHIQGGQCSDGRNHVNYLGIKTFFEPDNGHTDPFHYGDSQVLVHCVTSDVTFVIRIIIALCFLLLISSLTACVLDMIGSSRVVLRFLRSTASFQIFSVCICVVITGLCYLLTQLLTSYYEANRMHEGSRIVVEFDIGFYMITAAGAVSVIAVGSTLMLVYSPSPSAARGWSHDSQLDSANRRRQQQLLESDVCRIDAAVGARVLPVNAPPPYRP